MNIAEKYYTQVKVEPKAQRFTEIPEDYIISKTAMALEQNGIEAIVVNSGAEAKRKVLEMIPKGSEVMTMSSITLETLGLDKEFNESGKYDSVRKQLMSMKRETQGREMRKLGAAPDYAIGSVHAVTEDGKVFVASMSGSQIPGYVFGAGKVVWVIGAQKIVRDEAEARERIEKYVLPLEDQHAMDKFGMHSGINKLLQFNKEAMPNRITAILVKERLGF